MSNVKYTVFYNAYCIVKSTSIFEVLFLSFTPCLKLNIPSYILLYVEVKMTKQERNQRLKKAKERYHQYSYLFKQFKIIGVTGTNGKSTTTTLVYQYLKKIHQKVTLIGTSGIWINDQYMKSINTTPGIDTLYQIFLKSYEEKVKYIVMEVSSHAIDQERIAYIPFSIALMTNITLDHLDYHKTFEQYKKTKLKFLKHQKKGKIVLLNGDMRSLNYFLKRIDNKKFLYGLKGTNYQILSPKIDENGVEFTFLRKQRKKQSSFLVKSNLLGMFNIYNLCSFLTIIDCLKLWNEKEITSFLNSTLIIDGRMNEIHWKERRIIIDYAHTPDGVEQVLSFLAKIKKHHLITMIGCGGNRDQTKRPLIGRIVAKYSDFFIFTSDNPRDEDPKQIIKDMMQELSSMDHGTIEVDRKNAIKTSIEISEEKDIIAILGRGNEKYQKVGREELPFLDSEVLQEILHDDI